MRFPWDDTGVLSQALGAVAAGVARRRQKCEIEIFYLSLILSALRTIISHYLSLFLIISHPISPLQYLCNVIR